MPNTLLMHLSSVEDNEDDSEDNRDVIYVDGASAVPTSSSSNTGQKAILLEVAITILLFILRYW